MYSHRGFSFLELLAVLLITALLVTVAVPAYQKFVASVQVSSATNLLVAHLRAARRQAVARSSPVAICVSNDQETCSNTTDWESGWIVFTDVDGMPGVRDGADELLHTAEASGDSMSLGSGSTYVRFDSQGKASAN